MTPIRVSTVLKVLYPYSLDFVRQEDLDRGTRLHFAMELYCNNRIQGFPQGEIQEEIKPMVQWLEDHGFEPESAEEFISHQWGFGGHPDAIGSIMQVTRKRQTVEEPIWLDWKFSETITEQNQMQGTVYTKLTGRRGFFLQCPRGGAVKAVPCKPDAGLWAAFLSGLNVLKFQQTHIPMEVA